MNVYEEAHGLARAIRECEEYKQYQALRDKIEQNPSLAEMVHDFEAKQVEMQARQMAGEISPQEMQAQMQGMYQILMTDPSAAEYYQPDLSERLRVRSGNRYAALHPHRRKH